jgi:hypothetical protein
LSDTGRAIFDREYFLMADEADFPTPGARRSDPSSERPARAATPGGLVHPNVQTGFGPTLVRVPYGPHVRRPVESPAGTPVGSYAQHPRPEIEAIAV